MKAVGVAEGEDRKEKKNGEKNRDRDFEGDNDIYITQKVMFTKPHSETAR